MAQSAPKGNRGTIVAVLILARSFRKGSSEKESMEPAASDVRSLKQIDLAVVDTANYKVQCAEVINRNVLPESCFVTRRDYGWWFGYSILARESRKISQTAFAISG